MFELEVLFANVIVPAAMVLLVCLLVLHKSTLRLVHLALAVCSGLAIWAAFALRIGFAWWPEDAWQKVPVAAMLVTAVAVVIDLVRSKPVRTPASSPATENASASVRLNPQRFTLELFQGAALAAIVACAAWLIFPTGGGWDSVLDQRYQWCAVITLAVSFSWWGIAGCQPAVASAVGLATIPLLIASAFLNSLSMMKVTEPMIAIATVLGLCSLIDWRLTGRRTLPIMIAPTLFAMSGFVQHANLQSYLDLPRTLYFLAMLSPAIVALVARTSQQKSKRLAIGLTIVLALVLAAAIGGWAYTASDAGHADEW
ncbi:MAG: hypothetical protein SFV81_09875 [Pirellulaceae bacterium]|nr:hypothetical protein [Pirellulaceae bacterium]